MFPLVQPRGAVVRPKAIHVPKKQKWAHILPEKLVVISEKLQLGWDVVYVDGSKNEEGGVNFAGWGCGLGQTMSVTQSYPSLCMKNKQSPKLNSQQCCM